MKILVGNNHLHVMGGSETFVYSFGAALKTLGHEVHVYAPTSGIVSKMMDSRLGIPLVKPTDSYDAIFTAHTGACNLVKHFDGFKVQTCHGAIPRLEQPVIGMNEHVTISEEVQTHCFNAGFHSTLIRNGVDMKRFSSKRQINSTPKRILCLSQGGLCAQYTQTASKLIGAEFRIRNKFNATANFDIEQDIDWADLVVTLGRGAYESAAMGRNVFVWDTRSYNGNKGDGMLDGKSITESLKYNCSGRRYKHKWTDPKQLANKFSTEYSIENGKFLYEYAKEHLNSIKQAEKYICLIP